MNYQNTINLYVQETKVTNVAGRIEYMSTPEAQQEKLLAVYGQQSPEFWQQLAFECQRDYKCTKEKAKCIEAREYIIYVPNSFTEKDMPSLKRCIDSITGTDCLMALHDSHKQQGQTERDENRHIHALIPERRLLQKPEVKIAERNYFIDEDGKRVRTKKEILDEDGKVRDGCQIIKKGEIYKVSCFSSKNELLARADFFNDVKEEIAEWINQELQPDLKRVVYDRELSPTIPQFKKEKGLSDEQLDDIRICNDYIKAYNKLVRSGEIDQETAMFNKTLIMLSPDRATEIDNILNEYEEKNIPDFTASVESNRPEDSPKERLRGLYKEAAEERKKGNIQQARRISKQINLLREELGMFTSKDYERAIETEKKEIAYFRKRLRLLQLKAIKEENFLKKSLEYATNRIMRAKELMNKKDKNSQYELAYLAAMLYIRDGVDIMAEEFVDKSVHEIMAINETRQQVMKNAFDEEMKKIDALIKEADEAIGKSSTEENGDIYAQIESAKDDYLQARKKLKEKRKELKKQLELEATEKKKEGKVVGLAGIIRNAAVRSGTPANSSRQEEKQKIR